MFHVTVNTFFLSIYVHTRIYFLCVVEFSVECGILHYCVQNVSLPKILFLCPHSLKTLKIHEGASEM